MVLGVKGRKWRERREPGRDPRAKTSMIDKMGEMSQEWSAYGLTSKAFVGGKLALELPGKGI